MRTFLGTIGKKAYTLQRERRNQVEPRCAEQWHLRDDEGWNYRGRCSPRRLRRRQGVFNLDYDFPFVFFAFIGCCCLGFSDFSDFLVFPDILEFPEFPDITDITGYLVIPALAKICFRRAFS